MSYNWDNALIVFDSKEPGTRGKTPGLKKSRRKNPDRDTRRDHKPTNHDSPYLCPHHDTPLKRYEANKNRFRGYGPTGERITRPDVYYRCNHCLWLGRPSYYSQDDVDSMLRK